jgi:putative flippase GtrA
MEPVRFLVVAVTGLIVDLAVAWSVAHFLGLPLWLAAAVGFFVAAAMNYVLHELWTFRAGMQRISAGRATRYGIALAATLGVRVATVAGLSGTFGSNYVLPVLVAGAGVSFCVNYLLSKHFVFRPSAKSKESVP